MTDSDVWRAVWQHVAVAGLSLVNFVDTFPGHLKTSAILNNQSPAGRGTPRLCNGLGILGLDLVSDDDDSLAARTRLGLTRSSARDTNRHQHDVSASQVQAADAGADAKVRKTSASCDAHPEQSPRS